MFLNAPWCTIRSHSKIIGLAVDDVFLQFVWYGTRSLRARKFLDYVSELCYLSIALTAQKCWYTISFGVLTLTCEQLRIEWYPVWNVKLKTMNGCCAFPLYRLLPGERFQNQLRTLNDMIKAMALSEGMDQPILVGEENNFFSMESMHSHCVTISQGLHK